MPRASRNRQAPVEDPKDLARRLLAWSRGRYTQSQLAAIAGVSQPQLSRILAGNFSGRSKAARRLCDKAGIDFRDVRRRPTLVPSNEHLLTAAIEGIWDGTAADANRINQFMQLLSALRRNPLSNHRPGRSSNRFGRG